MKKNSHLTTAFVICLLTSVTFCNNVFAQNGVERIAANVETLVPQNYYDRYLYSVSGTCSNLDSIYFNFASSWQYVILGSNVKNEPIVAELKVQLMPNGSYFAEYQEIEVFEGVPNSNMKGYVTFSKMLKGTWSVDGDQITLSGLGTGKPGKYQRTAELPVSDVIEFQLQTVFKHQNALNQKFIIGRSSSNVSVEGTSINEYCGIKK